MQTPEELAVELQGIMDIINKPIYQDDLPFLATHPIFKEHGACSWEEVSTITPKGIWVEYYENCNHTHAYELTWDKVESIPSEDLYMIVRDIKICLKENPNFPL
jgi:hypothetical protein